MSIAPPAHAAAPAWIDDWLRELPTRSLAELVPDPATAAVFSTDMIPAFLTTGNLASARVGTLAGPVVALFRRAHALGVRRFVLLQDSHDPRTPEFDAWPEHAVRGTPESTTIPELRALPFAADFAVIEKNSLNPAIETGLDAWLDAHPEILTALVVGDCTDLCVYQLAMHLRLRANARNLAGFRVVVPADAVETYDLSSAAAAETGAFAHPGDFFHAVFLYHMALNGIDVVRTLTS